MICVIPAAGLGTRVGMKRHESKEMLYVKAEKQRVIDYSLKLCKKHGIRPIVVSREEKKDLNDYCTKKGVDVCLIDDSKEWADSVYQSNPYWGESNILIFPDTRWENSDATIKKIKFDMSRVGVRISLGVLEVEDMSKWCGLYYYNSTLIEKHIHMKSTPGLAFGVIGFSKYAGLKTFEEIRVSGRVSIPPETQFFELEGFKDITRKKSKKLIRKK